MIFKLNYVFLWGMIEIKKAVFVAMMGRQTFSKRKYSRLQVVFVPPEKSWFLKYLQSNCMSWVCCYGSVSTHEKETFVKRGFSKNLLSNCGCSVQSCYYITRKDNFFANCSINRKLIKQLQRLLHIFISWNFNVNSKFKAPGSSRQFFVPPENKPWNLKCRPFKCVSKSATIFAPLHIEKKRKKM